MKVRCADERDHLRLPEIERPEVRSLFAEDIECLDLAGSTLVEFGLHRSLGITRLHRHFHVRQGEVLVEWVPKTADCVVIDVMRKSVLDSRRFTPLNVSLQPDGDAFVGVASEFAPADEVPAFDWENPEVEPCLQRMGERLSAFGMLNRFGIGLIRNRLPGSDGGTLLELTNEQERRLLFHLLPADYQFDAAADVETFWSFRPVRKQTDTQAGIVCKWGPQTVCRWANERFCRLACRVQVGVPFPMHENYHVVEHRNVHRQVIEWRHSQHWEHDR